MRIWIRRKFSRAATCITFVAIVVVPGLASDWPTYRGDGMRSGYTAEELPANLAPCWSYRPRHAPMPAWPGRDTRMPFDRAFHTVIVGDTLLFGSSADGKVRALNTATGEERWTFLTGAPVRFAPAVWRDRAFVVSDDGFLYCLGAQDGKLLWKLRGGPSDSMVLGNGRLISRWPARGGPVVADGVVYWAAGIWPSEGAFIYATDALTGKVVWCNNKAGGMFMPQPHPTANAYSGVSAQGDLLVVGDKLLVPTGRAVPAAFSRATGKLLYFHLQAFGKAGGASIAATDSHFFDAGYAFDAATGKQGFRPGADAMTMAITPETIVYATAKEIAAVDRGNLWQKKVTVSKGKKSTQTVFTEPIWRIPNPHKPISALIVAGDKAIVGSTNKVSVLDMKSRKVLLTKPVDGEPLGLAVAGGRLFVSTDRGTIHCFDGTGTVSPRIIQEKRGVSDPSDPSDAAADEIIRRTGISEGYCLDVACGDGELAAALARKTRLHICAMDADPEKVALARRKLDAAGLYGVRVSVHQDRLSQNDLPNYFANLIVSGRSVSDGANVPQEELNRVLRPYGGKSCFGRPGAMTVTERGNLAGAGTWTHQYCDPANTCCSTDTLVKGPLGIAWFNDLDFRMPSRHGRGPAPLFYKGRLFIEGLGALRCVDAYNGRVLWEYPLPNILKAYDGEHLMGVSGTGSNLCIAELGLFVRTENKCLRLDPVTGKLLDTFTAPNSSSAHPGEWGMVACVGDTLIGTIVDTAHIVTFRFKPGDMQTQWTESKLLFAMDAVTGRLKWSWRPKDSVRHNAIAIGGGRVYVIDRDEAVGDRTREKKRGIPDKGFVHPAGKLFALDLASGKVVWESDDDIFGTLLALSEEHQTLVMCYQDWRFKLVSELGGRLAAFDTATGRRRWDIRAPYSTRPIIYGQTVLFQTRGWDLLTGRPKDLTFPRSYGCGIPAASRNLMVFRSATLGYVDLQRPRGVQNFGGIRPGCWINAVPAGGLVLMPDATDLCTCSYLIKASIALQPWRLNATER